MNSPRFSAPLWLRYAAIACGLAILVWLPFEDTSTLWVVLLAAWISLLSVLYFGLGREWDSNGRVLLLAALGGLAVTPLAVVLIVLKSGAHGHAAADFTFRQIVALTLRTPVWLLGSVLIALGLILWRGFRRTWIRHP